MDTLSNNGGLYTAWDDVTNGELVVKDARGTGMEFCKEMGAYTRCRRDCVEKEHGKWRRQVD